MQANPFEGGKQAVAEAWRNLVAAGATPLAATDNLNFGNPEKHDILAVLSDCAASGRLYQGALRRDEGESWDAYFERHLKASFDGRQIHALMEVSCRDETRQGISDAFDRAAERVMRSAV